MSYLYDCFEVKENRKEPTFLNQDEFAESLTFLLNHECSEEIILEFSQQKYHELKQRFS